MTKIDTAKVLDGCVLAATTHQVHRDAQNIGLSPETFSIIRSKFAALHEQLTASGMVVSAQSVAGALGALDQADTVDQGRVLRGQPLATFQGHVGEISNIVKYEFSTRLMVAVRADFALYYNKGDLLFGQGVLDGFPSAAADIDEAGKCLAFERPNAAVFHLMKVMEHALRAVHACLGINVPLVGNDRNWGNILNRINTEVGQRGRRWAEHDAFQEIHAFLNAVKTAWRNPNMHVDRNYTADEAAAILNAVHGFLVRLSSRMDEAGQPLA